MRLKTLLLPVAALGAVSAAVFFLNRPTPPPTGDARIGQPLVDTATAEKAARLSLSDQGKTVVVAKQPDGSWRVAAYHDFPADFQKLSAFIGELTAAKVEQFVSANPERVSRLEFKDTRIALLDAADKELWSITLGKNADAGGRFVRFDAETKAYRTDLGAWLDAEPRNWADATILALKADDIAKVELPFPDSPAVVAARAKKEDAFAAENPPAGQKLKTEKIASLLGSFAGVRFSDTSDLADANAVAAKQNARAVKLTTFDGKTLALTLGRKPEQKIPKPAAPTPPPAPGTATPPPGIAKPAEPEFETVPSGPVYLSVAHSDAAAPINALMQKRAFQVYEHLLTSLPAKADELFEPTPAPVPPAGVTAPATTPTPTPAAK